MSNWVETDENVALGFGIDFRINRYEINEASCGVIYANKRGIANTSAEALSNVVSSYHFPTTGIACTIESSDISDTTQAITIQYYADPDDIDISVQNVMLNGTTPVAVPNNIFRVARLIASGSLNGNVKLTVSGNSAQVLSCIESDLKYSRDPYFWVPKGAQACVVACKMFSTCSESVYCDLVARRYPTFLSTAYTFEAQRIPVQSNFIDFNLVAQPAISEQTTYVIECQKQSGGATNPDLTVLYEFVLTRAFSAYTQSIISTE